MILQKTIQNELSVSRQFAKMSQNIMNISDYTIASIIPSKG